MVVAPNPYLRVQLVALALVRLNGWHRASLEKHQIVEIRHELCNKFNGCKIENKP